MPRRLGNENGLINWGEIRKITINTWYSSTLVVIVRTLLNEVEIGSINTGRKQEEREAANDPMRKL